MKISVIKGNIATIKSDALVTTVNSQGLWFGALDNLIREFTGSDYVYEILAARLKSLGEGAATMVPVPRQADECSFSNVIFVIDDLNKDLWVPIYNALEVAEFAGLNTITIPSIRRGVKKGAVEKTTDEYIFQFQKGIREWIIDNDSAYCNLQSIKIVVYNDEEIFERLKAIFE